MCYESSGDIWYSNSWDGGSNWSREELVSQGDGKYSHPSVEQVYLVSGQTYSKTEVVWEENPVNGTGYRIWARKRDEPNGSWGSSILVHEDLTSRPSAALPTISGTIVCWRGPNSLLYRDILVNPPPAVQSVAGTDQNSSFQAVDVYLGYSYFVWEQTGVGIKYLSPTTGIVYSLATNAGSATNTHPVVVRNKSGDACIAWEYKNTASSQGNIKFCTVSPTGVISPTKTFVNCPGSGNYPTSPTLSSNHQDGLGNDDLTLSWNSPSVGVVCARYTGGSWTSPFRIASSGQYGSVNKTSNPGETQRIVMFKGTTGPVYALQTVSIAAAPPVPAQATLLSPTDNSTNVALSPTLTWSCMFGAETYDLQVSATSDFAAPVVDVAGLAATSYNVPSDEPLNYSTPYWWHVRAHNTSGYGNWSTTWSFTTTPPLLTLSTGTGNHPKLQWSVPTGYTAPYKVYRYYCTVEEEDCFGSPALIATISDPLILYYVDLAVLIASHDPVSTAWYYVKWTNSQSGQLSTPSNKVSTGTSNIYWKAGIVNEAVELPAETKLSANYPNPFNPTTTIEYQLAAPGYVRLSIFNILGEEIARLADGDHAAGYYSAAWDAGAAPSGIYYARIAVSDPSRNELYRRVTKLLLMK